MEEFLNLKFIPKTENKYPIDVEQLWEYAKNGKQVGFNGGYYYIETITQDFFSEVSYIKFLLKNTFVNELKFGKGKVFGQKFKYEWLCTNAIFQQLTGIFQNLSMVKWQFGNLRHLKPRYILGP